MVLISNISGASGISIGSPVDKLIPAIVSNKSFKSSTAASNFMGSISTSTGSILISPSSATTISETSIISSLGSSITTPDISSNKAPNSNIAFSTEGEDL